MILAFCNHLSLKFLGTGNELWFNRQMSKISCHVRKNSCNFLSSRVLTLLLFAELLSVSRGVGNIKILGGGLVSSGNFGMKIAPDNLFPGNVDEGGISFGEGGISKGLWLSSWLVMVSLLSISFDFWL